MTREELKNQIEMEMYWHLDAEQRNILDFVLIKNLKNVEVTKEETLPNVIDNNNENYINMFLLFKDFSDKTRNQYKYALRRLLDCVDNKNLLKVSQFDIQIFLRSYLRGNSERSINNYKRNISAFYSWLVKQRIIQYNPCDSIESLKEIRKPIQSIEPSQMDEIKRNCKTPRERALIETFRCLGCRVGELVNIQIKDIDFEKNIIYIYGEKTRTYRYCCFDDIAKKYIKEYFDTRKDINNESYLIEGRNGKMTTDGIRCILYSIEKRSDKIPHLYTHLFRKTVVTTIIRRGGSEQEAGDYVGHRRSSVTGACYYNPEQDHVINIFNKYLKAV